MQPTVKTTLFDFDGVIVNTEPLYDVYWNKVASLFGLSVPDFASQVRGKTTKDIVTHYFSSFPTHIQQSIIEDSDNFERQMPFPLVSGAIEFIRLLKRHQVQVGLVTSSDDFKVNRALELLGLTDTFDAIVTARRITRGKPDPMCYLLAAQDLQVNPADCIVFEDSFAGIESARQAGMEVIGISTTNPASLLIDKVSRVLPDFTELTFKEYTAWCL